MVDRPPGGQAAPPDVVVVGVDGSEAGERAARFAAREGDTSRVIAFVVPWSPYAVQTVFAMSIPNIIGLYLLMRVIKRELHDYEGDLNSGAVSEVEA